jgi:hypothetical protein
MKLFIFLMVLFFGLLGALGWLRWRESKYLKKPVKETLSPSLKKELEKEEQDAERRKKSFEGELKKFGL